jgi:hypothetical protein
MMVGSFINGQKVGNFGFGLRPFGWRHKNEKAFTSEVSKPSNGCNH